NTAIVRYNGAGQLDPTFNGSGKLVDATVIVIHFSNSQIVQQGDGRLVLAGLTPVNGDESNSQLLVARYNTDGSADNTFASTGKFIQNGFDSNDRLAILPDQTIAVATGALIGLNPRGTNQSTFLGSSR